jgi:hypothetical protein
MAAPVLLALCPASVPLKSAPFTLRAVCTGLEPGATIFWHGIAMTSLDEGPNVVTAEVEPPTVMPDPPRFRVFVINPGTVPSNVLWVELTAAPWYDLEATLAAVLATLRLQQGDIDTDHLAECIPAAATAIEQYLDRIDVIPGPPPPPSVQIALEAATIALYHRDEVTATIGGGVSTLRASSREQFDPLEDVLAELTPMKQQWGVA